MGRCQEPHCLQEVPDHLWELHQDEHVAERLAAEEFESSRQRQDDFYPTQSKDSDPFNFGNDDSDAQLALALNREFQKEDEERSFRQIQVYILSHADVVEERNRR